MNHPSTSPIFVTLLYSYYVKVLVACIRLLGKGSGTSIGGWLSEKYLPHVVSHFVGKYSKVVFISGTNGKTTTRSIINHFLEAEHRSVCSNRGGANIFRGIVTALMLDLTWSGNVKSEFLVLEVEEATLPRLTRLLPPDILVLTNIFRDQLDAYGEIDATLRFFITSIESSSPIIVLNNDDNKLVNAVYTANISQKSKLYGFGVSSEEKIKYEPEIRKLQAVIDKVLSIVTDNSNKLTIRTSASPDSKSAHRLYTAYSHLPGIYNVYNIAAAIQTTSLLLDSYDYIRHLDSYSPAFGRGEVIEIENTKIHLFLVKNPAGYDSVLNHIKKHFDPASTHLVFALNDKIADGKDISWIWDVDFEGFFNDYRTSSINTLGTRKEDMLLRLQYAGGDVNSEMSEFELKQMLRKKELKTSAIESIVVLATYTALLEIRQIISSDFDLKINSINDTTN